MVNGCKAQTGNVSLDTLGLTVGVNYPFNVFHAERRCCASTFKVYTTIDLQCLWTDHCGICYGDGQSCCTCDKSNPCVETSCNIDGSCKVVPNVCPDDGDLCTIETCNSTKSGTFSVATHCYKTSKNCNDNDLCTADSCTSAAGCQNKPILCDDNDVCTSSICTPSGGCVHGTRNTCNDNNSCTIDSCDATIGK